MSGRTLLVGILVAVALAGAFKYLVSHSSSLFHLGGTGGASGEANFSAPTLSGPDGYASGGSGR